jgi:hypothetical protein
VPKHANNGNPARGLLAHAPRAARPPHRRAQK